MSDEQIINELREEVENLRGKVSALLTFGSAKVCKSCARWYPQGFACGCGRDNTYSNEEWEEQKRDK